MPPKKKTTATASLRHFLPAELVRRCADFTDAPGALALHQACGKAACGVSLALAFKNANELTRSARLRTESDENMFKRWESLVRPLRCVVVVMKEGDFGKIFRGAARRGIEALSELDASRVDVAHRRRDVNWRVIDKHFRKVMREMPESLQQMPEFENDDAFLQAARGALGDAESADALFNAGIVALLFNSRLQREFGENSPTWSWIARHARIHNAAESVPSGGTAAYQLVVDFCLEMGVRMGGLEEGAPRMGDQDLASVYERERRQPLPACMEPKKYHCDGCFAKNIEAPDQAKVTVACPLCSYALCAGCSEGVADHRCDGRCVHFGVKVLPSRRWRGEWPDARPLGGVLRARLDPTTTFFHTGPLRRQDRPDHVHAIVHGGLRRLFRADSDRRAAGGERGFALASVRAAALDTGMRPRPPRRAEQVARGRPGACRIPRGDVRAEPFCLRSRGTVGL